MGRPPADPQRPEGTGPETERFTDAERRALAPYFTNLDRPVFALVNLPEVVKGALFARYSRSPKSLRRLFLDEFLEPLGGTCEPAQAAAGETVSVARAEKLYDRMLLEYGDDSVAQLGGAHLACEGASNLLTKVLEWGRLAAYLEQSTRYVPLHDRPKGRFRYHVPAELASSPLREGYVRAMDEAFETYARWLEPLERHFAAAHPAPSDVSPAVHRRTIRAKALDTLRGLLPAATEANVGIFATGQAYEAMLLRMRSHPLAEARSCADAMLRELREVIPAFLRRVDVEDRGGAASRYLAETRAATAELSGKILAGIEPEPQAEVVLTDHDPEGEVEVVAAALYPVSRLGDAQLRRLAREMTPEQRTRVLAAYIGRRGNRRHRPGRAFERTSYRFDVLADYGAFRDLQRHRMLTLEWQPLSPDHGYEASAALDEVGALGDFERVMRRSAETYQAIRASGLEHVAPYALSMAYRVRCFMQMNAREAMHVIELRTAPQGHPSYRRICQEMHRLIEQQAGHRALAAAMSFTDHSPAEQGRLDAERAAERRRGGQG